MTTDLIDADGTAHIADDSHTRDERRLDPGVYLSPGYGHALLVGINQRNLTVLDLGGVIQVGGINVTDPDHLDEFAAYWAEIAATFRARREHAHPTNGDNA